MISSGGLSPLTHLGPSPRLRTQDSELRLRRQLGEVGSVLRKPEAEWAPPPPHPTPALPRPSLTQAHPRLEAGQQGQQCHQQRRRSPAKPHGQNKRPTVCPSEGLSAASRAPEAPLPVLGWGGCFWHLLLPLPGAPFSQTTGPTGLGAESVGPEELASPGRGLNRRISSCAARPARTPDPTPGGPRQRGAPGGGSPARPRGISSSKQSSNRAHRAPHGHPVRKGVILMSWTRHRKGGGLV